MSWWDTHLPKRMAEFEQWTGNPQSATKKYIREHIAAAGYKTMLDAAAGLCVQWDALQEEKAAVEYRAIDSCLQLVEQGQARGVPVIHGDIRNLPWGAAHFDVVVAQHVLEHMPSYEDAMHELVRVARCEVVVVFFLPPWRHRRRVVRFDGELYNNTYSAPELELFLARLSRFKSFRWVSIERKPDNGIPFDAVLHLELTS